MAASPEGALVNVLFAKLPPQPPSGFVGVPSDFHVGHPPIGHCEPPVGSGNVARRLQTRYLSHIIDLANEANSELLFYRGIVLGHGRRGYLPGSPRLAQARSPIQPSVASRVWMGSSVGRWRTSASPTPWTWL